MTTLTELNALRVAIGKAPLKAWKESKAKLAEAVKKLAAKSTTEVQLTASASSQDNAMKGIDEAMKKPVPAAKKQATKKTPKKAMKTPAKKVEGIALSTIAEEIGMNPKVARAKLRRAEGTEAKDGRWVFTEAQAAKIKELLKGDARKKA